MRIVTWNCCRGPFDKKMAALESLRPDIAIVPEAIAPEAQTDELRWFPSNASRLGIQVRAFNGYRLAHVRKASSQLPNCVSPVHVMHSESGAEFSLLAVWTWRSPSYSRALLNGLAAYARLLRRGPAIVAGDFNGSPFFDRPTARVKRWGAGFEQLHAAGLVSAYHRHHEVAYGCEAHATHHFLRKPERPFHIDFCFVPQAWAEQGLAVQLVNDEPWRRLSDHFPLVVDVGQRGA